jgi:predicted lipoprotein with Yx(FWY)xxD motif
MAKTIGSQTILIAGSNGMTVYTFTSDTAGSGKSACSGGCLTKWPALTVAAGATTTAGSGVTGQLGTITRVDDGSLQVTYNGLPLYFFQNDKAPGDTNGSYPNWNLVKP